MARQQSRRSGRHEPPRGNPAKRRGEVVAAPPRGAARANKQPADRAPSRVRVSARVGGDTRPPAAPEVAPRVAKPAKKRGQVPLDPASPPLIPVRTAMTPRPEITLPQISVVNVDWEDDDEAPSPLIGWPQAQRRLAARLAEVAPSVGETRFDLRDGRLVWLDVDGVAVAEARAQLIASFSRASSELVMAWSDPVLVSSSIPRLEEYGDSLELDEPQARELVLAVADSSGAELVHALEAPHVVHYLALRALRPAVGATHVTPGTPVGLVLRGLADLRRSVSRRDEPTDVVRARFLSLGKTLVQHAEGPYANSEWVSRLQRAGRVLMQLAGRLVPPTFSAIAAGRPADEWIAQAVAVDLADGIKLLEDEWGAFA